MLWVQHASQAVNDKSQWPTILAVVLSLTVVMVTTVALRGYVRGFMLKTIGKDDWVILFSAVSFAPSRIMCPRNQSQILTSSRFAVLSTVG